MRLELESNRFSSSFFGHLKPLPARGEADFFFGFPDLRKKSGARIVEAVLGAWCLEFVSFHRSNHPQDALYMGGAGSDNYKNFFLCHLSTVEDHSELDTLDDG